MTGARDPLRFFRAEAREISGELGRTVLALEKSPAAGQVARLLRLAHTLKGAAAVVRQRGIAAASHALEDALVPLRDRESAATAADIERILACTDAIAAQVAVLETPAEGKAAPQLVPAGIETGALIDMLGEAGILIRRARQGETMALEQAEREVAGAREAAERLRLSSCGAMLAALERAVRDTAAGLGRQAVFMASGGEARLEAGMLGPIQQALLQLGRNAVAHGLESDEERRRAGKTVPGRVEIVIARERGSIRFTCRDDGRGIDLAAVRRAARDDERTESEEELLALLFQGGVSTSAAVTELSGRGVGLDIVRDTAQRLGGDVSARTMPGRGTEISLLVPASLAAMEALLVEAGGMVCAIPLDAVRGTRRLAGDDVTRDGEQVMLDGSLLAFATLARLMRRAAPPPGFAVLAGHERTEAVIGVERLLGVADIVVRPLPGLSFAEALVAGASPDAEGVPRLVLEPQALVAAALTAGSTAPLPATAAPPPILVIDDSLTTRALEQSILEAAGYEVDLATSAEEGLLKARQRRYGLFLVDVEMPGMDGFSFIRTIRADPELRAVPAILVTSLGAPEDRRRGAEAGAQAYVVKSEFNQVQVLDTIRRCLEAA